MLGIARGHKTQSIMRAMVIAVAAALMASATLLFLEKPMAAACIGLLTGLSFIVVVWNLKAVILKIQSTMDNVDHGLVFFDRRKILTSCNPKAASLLPALLKPENGVSTLSSFLSYVYDHAFEAQDDFQFCLRPQPQDFLAQTVFQDLIKTEDDKILLVKVHQNTGNTAIAILTDVTLVQMQYQHMADLVMAVNLSPHAVLIADARHPSWPIIFLNKAAEEVFDFSLSESEDLESLEDLLRDKTPDDQLDKVFDALKAGRQGLLHVQRKGRWFEMHLASVSGPEGYRLITAFLADQTEARVHKEHLIQSQKMEAIGQLAGGIAHDFNNLLSIIDGYARSGKSLGDSEGHFDRIQQAVAKGSALTRRLLLFGAHNISDDRVVNVTDHIKQDMLLLKPLIPENIHLIVKSFDDSLAVECSPDALSQIIVNLILNARDAIAGKGVVTISTYPDPKDSSWVCIEVVDNGSGIRLSDISKIFDPFFTTKAPGKGTGLGLSMVYGLVRQMGGRVEVESQLGDGTIFYVYIPRSSQEAQSKKVTGYLEDVSSIRLEGYTALLAEDEPDLRNIMSYALEQTGLKVLSAGSGQEALAVQEDFQQPIDFLITDIVMPELDGVRLASLFQEVRPETKIVYMSGYPAQGQMAAFSLPDNALFLAKPVVPDRLIQILFAATRSAQEAHRVLSMAPHWDVQQSSNTKH